MKIKHYLIVILIALSIGSVFFLIPQEDEIPPTPQIYKPQPQTYETVSVQKGDLVDIATLNCTYTAIKEESLYFNLSGLQIENILVKTGDNVKSGDVLANLDMGNLENELMIYTDNIEKYNLQLSLTKSKRDEEYNNHVKYLNTLSEEERKSAISASEKVSTYITQIDLIEDQLYIENLKKTETEEKISKRQIIAPFDGIITYVREFDRGETSNRDFTVINISDNNSAAFIASHDLFNLVEIGDEVEMLIDDVTYPAVAISAEEYGVIAEEDARKAQYFFRLIDSEIPLSDSTKSKVYVTTFEKTDVLYLPESTIRSYKGDPVVYYQNDDGIRELKEVKIGVTIDSVVEILSGVSEGELIIDD